MKLSIRVLYKMLQQLKEPWMCIKQDYNLENVCFLEFCYLSDDKEPFHTQYYPLLNTLACNHEGESEEVNKNIWGHCQKVYDEHSET